MIKAVIFDLGGVVIEHPVDKVIHNLSRILGIDEEELKEHHKLYAHDFAIDKISERDYFAKLGIGMDGASYWREALSRAYNPNRDVLNLVRELKSKGYVTAGLTNTEKPTVEFFAKQPEYRLFNPFICSCFERIAKPDHGIYHKTVGKINMWPEEVIFIDDTRENILGAKECGLWGIVFRGVERLRADLKNIGLKVD